MASSSGWRIGLVAAVLLTAATATARPVDGEPRVSSELEGFTVATLERLPKPPTRSRPSDVCRHYAAKPVSEAARSVVAQGWTITGESKLGAFTAVSFASRFEPATSGTCFVRDGNLGLFEGRRLIAVIYVPPGSRRSIGKISGLEGDSARVWDGEPPGLPVADIGPAGGRALRLSGLAAQETLCGGRAAVPNVYGMSINEARRVLWAKGWAPVPTNPPPEPRSREGELAKRGVTEVEGCSGTGFGYCRYNYRGGGGLLNVATVGDGDFPTVSSYAITCP
jgi:hypothetical protein